MQEHGRELDKLVHAAQAEYHRGAPMPAEGGQLAQGDADAPHKDDIGLHIEFGVASGTEDAVHYVVAEQSYNAPYDSTDYGQCETYAI